jgi:hypothetical protein
MSNGLYRVYNLFKENSIDTIKNLIKLSFEINNNNTIKICLIFSIRFNNLELVNIILSNSKFNNQLINKQIIIESMNRVDHPEILARILQTPNINNLIDQEIILNAAIVQNEIVLKTILNIENLNLPNLINSKLLFELINSIDDYSILEIFLEIRNINWNHIINNEILNLTVEIGNTDNGMIMVCLICFFTKQLNYNILNLILYYFNSLLDQIHDLNLKNDIYLQILTCTIGKQNLEMINYILQNFIPNNFLIHNLSQDNNIIIFIVQTQNFLIIDRFLEIISNFENNNLIYRNFLNRALYVNNLRILNHILFIIKNNYNYDFRNFINDNVNTIANQFFNEINSGFFISYIAENQINNNNFKWIHYFIHHLKTTNIELYNEFIRVYLGYRDGFNNFPNRNSNKNLPDPIIAYIGDYKNKYLKYKKKYLKLKNLMV